MTRDLISAQSVYPYMDCFSLVERVDYTLADGQRQKGRVKGVEKDFGSLPHAGSAPDSVQFCMAVLQHIMDHIIPLKTPEVRRAAFVHTFWRTALDTSSLFGLYCLRAQCREVRAMTFILWVASSGHSEERTDARPACPEHSRRESRSRREGSLLSVAKLRFFAPCGRY